MRKLLFILSVFTIPCYSFAQIQVSKKEGSSVVTNLGFGIKVNQGSTLKREYVILNDANCPVQLAETGIETAYGERSYSLKPVGTLTTKEQITAFEVNYVLYNVFGEHIKTLSGKEIVDIETNRDLSKVGTWYASENQVSEYLICVAFIANVRTKSGAIWHYNYKAIKEQLNKLAITFDESYTPQKDKDKEGK